MNVTPGSVLVGKYRVEQVLGRGGMGIVVAATHLQLDERVAIKLMLPEVTANTDAVVRFVREARASAKIKSEHVARVSDVGVLEGGEPYMVMEYLEGSDLSSVLAARAALPLEEAADYLLQACEAIAEAHAIGIVHRDLKPANLFLAKRRDGSPVVKVLDFGISKVSGASRSDGDSSVTRTSALMGSPLYMSPEQMTSSRDVDARSDVWSLGVILFELVSGHAPFSGETLPQVCAAVLEARVPSVRGNAPSLPPELDLVIARCIARDPAARYADVAEFAQALLPFASRRARISVERIGNLLGTASLLPSAPDQDAPSSRVGSYPSTAMTAGSGTNAAWGDTRPVAPRRSLRTLAFVGVAVVGLMGIVAYALVSRHAASSEAAVSSAAPGLVEVANVKAPVIEPATAPVVQPTPVAAQVEQTKASSSSETPRAKVKSHPAGTRVATPKGAPTPRVTPETTPKQAPTPVGIGGRL